MISKLNIPNEEYGRLQMLKQITDCAMVSLVRTLIKTVRYLETVITELKIYILYMCKYYIMKYKEKRHNSTKLNSEFYVKVYNTYINVNTCSIIAYRHTVLLLYGGRRVLADHEISPNTPRKYVYYLFGDIRADCLVVMY